MKNELKNIRALIDLTLQAESYESMCARLLTLADAVDTAIESDERIDYVAAVKRLYDISVR